MSKIILLALVFVFFMTACGEGTTPKNDAASTADTANTQDTAALNDTAGTQDNSQPDTVDTVVTDKETVDNAVSDETAGEDIENSDADVISDPLLGLKKKITGVWAQKYFLTAKATAPVVSQVTTKTQKFTKLTITRNPDTGKLETNYNVCFLETDTGTDLVKTIFTQGFKEKFTVFKSPQFKDPKDEIEITGDESQLSFKLNKWYEVRGIHMTDPENDSMPEKGSGASDARIFDQDEDGHPGMSLKFQGVVTGDIYGAMRSYMILTSTTGSAQRIEGSVDWAEEDFVIEVTAPLLGSDRVISPNLAESNFVMVKVADNMTCDEIIAQKDTLFN